jgi:hypothetical protein
MTRKTNSESISMAQLLSTDGEKLREVFGEPKRFRIRGEKIGLRTDLNVNNTEEVLDILDGARRQ